jgi:hypothetical protein
MGQHAYKNDLVKPWRKPLSEQLVADLAYVPDGPLLALASKTPGGWSHRKPFLQNARRLFQSRHALLAADFAAVADDLPWMPALLKLDKAVLLAHQDELAGLLGGPRTALLCLLRSARAEDKESAIPAEVFAKHAAAGKVAAAKPDAKALRQWLQKVGAPAAEPGGEPEAEPSLDPAVQKLKQEIDRLATARENELRNERRHHAHLLAERDARLAALEAAAAQAKEVQALQAAGQEAAAQALQSRLTMAEAEVARLKDELAQAREHVTRKAREIAEALLSEELRPWFTDARKLREASEEVAKVRQLTAETVEKVRKAQRDADPFLAKEHELRQAIPQMEEMLKLLRRYQRTAGSVLPEVIALEKRVTDHIEKVRYELERRDLPSDPFLERISAKINGAENAELRAIEAALAAAEQSGLVDSRHADLYRGDIHRRRSLLADQRYHEQKQSGPVALLERAVALGEPARLGLDANNFACLQQAYLGLKLGSKRNAQGDVRLLLDPVARQKVVNLMEKLAQEGSGLLIWTSFDGQNSNLRVEHPRLKATFSRAGAKADHDLMDLVAKDRSSEGPWFIVSDDAEVRDACTRQGAFTLSNEAFVRLLVGRGLRP